MLCAAAIFSIIFYCIVAVAAVIAVVVRLYCPLVSFILLLSDVAFNVVTVVVVAVVYLALND